jgi:lipopolysaccharide export system protein LptC
MAGSPKEKLLTEEPTETEEESREVYLRDGRKLVLGETGANQLVEIRSESGQVEVRIELTEAGPVLRMEAVKLELKADQAIELESQKVSIKATEVKIESEDTVEVDAKGEVRVAGKMIYLN